MTNSTADEYVFSHIEEKDAIRLVEIVNPTQNCSSPPDSVGVIFSVSDIDVRHYQIRLDAAYTGTVSSVLLCVQPLPKPIVVLGADQDGICQGRDKKVISSSAADGGLGPNPHPATIILPATSSYFWHSYPTLKVDSTKLLGNGGDIQHLHCVSSSFADSNSSVRNMFRLEFRGQITQWIDVRDNASEFAKKLGALTTLKSVRVESHNASICATEAGQVTTIMIEDGNQYVHNYAPPIKVQDQHGDVEVLVKSSDAKGKVTMIRHVGEVFNYTNGTNPPSNVAPIGEDGKAIFTHLSFKRNGLFSIRARQSYRSSTFSKGSLIQSLLCRARAGTFTLSFGGSLSNEISFDALAMTVENAILKINHISKVKVHVSEGDASSAKICTETGDAPFYVEIIEVLDGKSSSLPAADFAFLPVFKLESTTLSVSPELDIPVLRGQDATGSLVIEKLYASRKHSPVSIAPPHPTRLAVLQYASVSNAAGIPFATQPMFELTDDYGHRVVSTYDSVRVSLLQQNRGVTLRCDASGGTFRLKWIEKVRTSEIAADFTAHQLKDTLEALPLIDEVNVTCFDLGTGYSKLDSLASICSEGGSRMCQIHFKHVNCTTEEDDYFSQCDREYGYIPALSREDSEPNLLTGGAATLTVEADSAATLLGSKVVALEDGVAVFTDLAIDRVGSRYIIKAELESRSILTRGKMGIFAVEPSKLIQVDISYPSGLKVLESSFPNKILPTADVPYLQERLQPNHIVRIAVTDLGGNILPHNKIQIDPVVSARFVNVSNEAEYDIESLRPSNATLVNGFAQFTGLHCSSSLGGSELRIQFSIMTPDLVHESYNKTLVKTVSPHIHKCVGPAVKLSIEGTSYNNLPGGSVKLPKIFQVKEGSRTVAVAPHSVSVMDVLSRFDAIYFSEIPTVNATPYYIHPSDSFDAFHFHLDRPYTAPQNSTRLDAELVSAWRVATGGKPLPQQPLVILQDANSQIVEFDEVSQVHVSLRPDPLTIECGGTIDGTNRIQTVSCNSDVSTSQENQPLSGSFALSFNGEVTGSILPTDSKEKIEEEIRALPSVQSVRVEIVETSSNLFGSGNEIYWNVPQHGGTACSSEFQSSIRIHFDDVLHYPSTRQEAASLPLMKVIPDRVQALTCVCKPHAYESLFALTFAGETSIPLPANATKSDFKAALEALPSLHLAGVRYVNTTSLAEADYPCSQKGDVRVLITLKELGVLLETVSLSGHHTSRIPLLQVTGLSGDLAEDTQHGEHLSIAWDVLYKSPESESKKAIRASFHVSGSTHAGPIDLSQSSSSPGKIDFSQMLNYRPISISRVCKKQPYETVFTLVNDGGTVVKSSRSSQIREIAGPAIPIYAGKPEHLRVAVQPAGISTWPTVESSGQLQALPISQNPVVHLEDAGGNLVTWVSGTPVIASFRLPGELESSYMNPFKTNLFKISISHGVANFSNDVLHASLKAKSSRQMRVYFWTTSTGNCTNSSRTTESWCLKGSDNAAAYESWNIQTNSKNTWLNGTCHNSPATNQTYCKSNNGTWNSGKCNGNPIYTTKKSCEGAEATSLHPFPSGLTVSNTFAVSKTFPIVGKPYRTRWLTQPPTNVTRGEYFTVQVEVVDIYGHRVFTYDDRVASTHNVALPTVSIKMEAWNDPQCPLSCAQMGSNATTAHEQTSSHNISISEGVITFKNLSIQVLNGMMDASIYRQSVQTIRILRNRSSGIHVKSFRLALDLSIIDDTAFGDYITTEISYNASKIEMTRRLQALPHIGRIDVVRNDVLSK